MTLEITQQVTDGPPAMEFSDYARVVSRRLHDLLSQEPDEQKLQHFLESHPSFVPGARTAGGGTCGSRVLDLLVARPELPGLGARIPDFMWLKATSDTWFPVLIEIEAPTKRIYRKKGGLLADFTHARNQLNHWRTWFKEPYNQEKFQAEYGVPSEWVERKTMRPHFILVYGRRREFENYPQLSKERESLLPGTDEELMSFDRLFADPLLSNALTVRPNGPRRYSALTVPPTLKAGPHGAERLLMLQGLDQAIDASSEMSAERREFLKVRLAHWRNWAEVGPQGWIDALDVE
jgi:hypothetical protein